jgi:hypothetical protein
MITKKPGALVSGFLLLSIALLVKSDGRGLG